MKYLNFIILILLFIININNKSLAQDLTEDSPKSNIEKTINIDKTTENKSLTISKDSIKQSLENILSNTKPESLMYNQEQYDNIEKAIEALRNDQPLVIEGMENDNKNKQSEEKEKTKESEQEENIKSYIYLSSIIFVSDDNWSIWINDKKFVRADNSRERELYFKKVSQDRVDILWKLSLSKWKILSGKKSESSAPKINDLNQVEVEFSLKPNQTFILGQNKVVNGRVKIVNNLK